MSRNFQHLYKEKSRKNERSHRANLLVELRNERREDLLHRKRLEPKPTIQIPVNYDVDTLNNAVKLCKSETNEDRAKGILILRSAIYSEVPACEHIVATPSFITLMLNLLKNSQNEDIQFDAACVLANLTIKYKSVRVLLTNEDTIKVLFNYLDPANARLCETTLLTVANIILDNPNAIGVVLSNNIFSICHQIITANPPIHVAKNVSYLLLNFTTKSVIKYGINPQVLPLILPIVKYLIKSNDEKTLSNILWAVANINDTNVENITLIIRSGILEKCRELLNQPCNLDVLHPTLRMFGNLATNDDEITQYVINLDLMPIISYHIRQGCVIIQKECLWFISNIAAGNNSQMALIFEGDLLSQVMDKFMKGTKAVSKEALWVLSNIMYTGKPLQIQFLLKLSLISHVCHMLNEASDPEIVFLCQEIFLFAYDNSGIPWGYITNEIELYGGLDSLDVLQEHSNKKISETATFILDQYVVSNSSQLADLGDDSCRDSTEGNPFDF